MLKLSEQFAELKKTSVLSHRLVGSNTISFVLASGHKLLMSEKELQLAISELSGEEPAAPKKIKSVKEK